MTSRDRDAQLMLELQVPATLHGMDAVHAGLTDCWPNLERTLSIDRRWQDEFSLAVAEIAANIIQYSHDPNAPLVEFALSLMHFPNSLVARFVDRGIVVNVPDVAVMPAVTGDAGSLAERGRGLAIVQATTDLFEYRRTPEGENIWTIEKYFLT